MTAGTTLEVPWWFLLRCGAPPWRILLSADSSLAAEEDDDEEEDIWAGLLCRDDSLGIGAGYFLRSFSGGCSRSFSFSDSAFDFLTSDSRDGLACCCCCCCCCCCNLLSGLLVGLSSLDGDLAPEGEAGSTGERYGDNDDVDDDEFPFTCFNQ